MKTSEIFSTSIIGLLIAIILNFNISYHHTDQLWIRLFDNVLFFIFGILLIFSISLVVAEYIGKNYYEKSNKK